MMHRWGPSGILAVQRWGTLPSMVLSSVAVPVTQTGADDVDWSTPMDASHAYAEGKDAYGALIGDAYPHLHILCGKVYDGDPAIDYRTDEVVQLSYPTHMIGTSEPPALRLSPAITSDNRLHGIGQDS